MKKITKANIETFLDTIKPGEHFTIAKTIEPKDDLTGRVEAKGLQIIDSGEEGVYFLAGRSPKKTTTPVFRPYRPTGVRVLNSLECILHYLGHGSKSRFSFVTGEYKSTPVPEALTT